MAVREWRIETPYRHDVRLEHGWWSGRVKIFLDERLVYERPTTLLDPGFQRQVIVDNSAYVVSARNGIFGFAYSFDQSEAAEPLAVPVESRKEIPEWLLAALLFPFAVLWLAMGMGIQIPMGKLAAPFPVAARIMFSVLGLVHIVLIVRRLHKWLSRNKS